MPNIKLSEAEPENAEDIFIGDNEYKEKVRGLQFGLTSIEERRSRFWPRV
jgi:hypothetical protein